MLRGEPYEQLLEEAKTADLLVVGQDSRFHFVARPDRAETLGKLLESKVCPILAVPEKPVAFNNVLIAYDGSLASSKAMRSYALLSGALPPVQTLRLLQVSENRERTRRVADQVCQYLAAYGLSAEPVFQSGDPGICIYQEARRIQPGLVVVGAYGHKGLRQIFWGSTTRRIIDDGTIPMLVSH